MTLGAMWVRTINDTAELVAISDSRLTGGMRWDQCPKIIPLARGDCIMSFSGETNYAYPMMVHALHTIDSFEESLNRRVSLEKLRGHLTRVFNSCLTAADLSGRSAPPDDETTFLLGGYSWWSQKWIMWSLHWNAGKGVFAHATHRSHRPGQRGAIAWTGTSDAVVTARRQLSGLMKDRGKIALVDGYNMEPLEVVRDVIRSGEFPSVGGPLQLGKVYRHFDSRLFVVTWRKGGIAHRTLAGRTLLGGETKMRLATIDPDRPSVFSYPALPEEELVET